MKTDTQNENAKMADNSKFTVNHVSNAKINKAYNSFVDGRISQRQYVQIVGAILWFEEVKKGLIILK